MKKVYSLILLITIGASANSQTIDWLNTTGGNEYDFADKITVDNEGNVYIVGIFSETVDFNPEGTSEVLTSIGNTDIYIQKLDSDGNHIWVKSIGTEEFQAPRANTIVVDHNNNVSIAGSFGGVLDLDPGQDSFILESTDDTDAFVLQLDSNGNFNWAISIGQSNLDSAYDMEIDSIGDLYVTGVYNQFIPIPDRSLNNFTYFSDVFTAKINASGNIQWLRTTDGPGYDIGFGIGLDEDNNVLVGGRFQETTDFDAESNIEQGSSLGGSDAFIMKLSNDGSFMWVKTFGGILREFIIDITIDNSGDIITTGIFNSETDFDPSDGVFNLTSQMYDDTFIQKLSADGDFIWANAFQGSGGVIPRQIKSNDNTIYLTGYFEESVDLDPGASVSLVNSLGNKDGYFTILNSDGTLKRAVTFGSTNFDLASGLSVVDENNIYLSGGFSNSVDFDPLAQQFVGSSQGGNDSFVLKYNESILGITEPNLTMQLSIGPNPTFGNIEVNGLIDYQELSLSIYNSLGQKLDVSAFVNGETIRSQISGATGIYFILINQDGVSSTYKIIKK